MIWLRLLGYVALVAIGSTCWSVMFFFYPIMAGWQLGFCDGAAELTQANPDCLEPLWYWLGITSVPAILIAGGIRKSLSVVRKSEMTE